MTKWECNNCKKQVPQNDYASTAAGSDPENLGWVAFTYNKGKKKTPSYVEVHLCPACLKKVMQFLGAEW